MNKQRYYAVRPASQGGQNTRIEKSASPQGACALAFGRGSEKGFQWKDLGTRVAIIQSDKKRIELLTSPEGWHNF